MPQFHDVCRVDEIPEGAARMFFVGGTRIGIFHVSGEFFALNDYCPHAGASLSHGHIGSGVVSCRMHLWRFCVRDGVYLDAPQPRFNVQTYPVRIVDDRVQIEI